MIGSALAIGFMCLLREETESKLRCTTRLDINTCAQQASCIGSSSQLLIHLFVTCTIGTNKLLRIPSSLLATLGRLDVFVDSLVLGLAATFLVLGSRGLLLLHLLSLAILDLLSGSVGVLVAVLARLGLLSADLLDGHADDGLLNAGRLAGSLLLNIVNFNLLVMGSPGHVPGQLNWLDLLVIETAGLRGDEIVRPSVL